MRHRQDMRTRIRAARSAATGALLLTLLLLTGWVAGAPIRAMAAMTAAVTPQAVEVPIRFDGVFDPLSFGTALVVEDQAKPGTAWPWASVPPPIDPESLHQSVTLAFPVPDGAVATFAISKYTISPGGANVRGPESPRILVTFDRRPGSLSLPDQIVLDPIAGVPITPPPVLEYVLRMRAHGGKWKDVLRQEATCDFLYKVPAGFREFSFCTAQGEPEQRACLESLGVYVDGRQFTTPRRFRCDGPEQGVH